MGKYLHDDVLDAALDELAAGTTLTVCSSQPTSRTEAITTYKLADVTIDSSDFTNADGDSSGRKVTIAQQSAVPIDTSGTATHIAICDSTRLLAVTECDSQALTSGGTVTVPAFKLEMADVT